MVHMLHEATGKDWKLARLYFGPYRVLSVTQTNAELRLAEKVDDPPIFVSLSRVRPCYTEMADTVLEWSYQEAKEGEAKEEI